MQLGAAGGGVGAEGDAGVEGGEELEVVDEGFGEGGGGLAVGGAVEG